MALLLLDLLTAGMVFAMLATRDDIRPGMPVDPLVIFVGVFVLVPLALIAHALIRAHRMLSVARKGQLSSARIKTLKASFIEGNGTRGKLSVKRPELVVTLPDGTTLLAETGTRIGREALEGWDEGARVEVLIDPARPDTPVPVQDVMA